jgi:Flp pilus assembly protein TadG
MKDLKQREKKNVRRRGIALAEAALMFPIFLMGTLIALQYGLLFVKLHTMTNAARQGARVAATWGTADAQGDQAIDALLVGDPQYAYYSHTVVTANALTTATVTLPTAPLQLINVVPMPSTLQAVVTLHKEL